MVSTYFAHKMGVDVNLGLGWSGASLWRDHGPGGVDGLDLEVELVELVVGEDVVSVPPSGSQLVQQRSDLSSGLQFRTRQGLK